MNKRVSLIFILMLFHLQQGLQRVSFRNIFGMPNVESVTYSITLKVTRCKVLSVSAGCVQDISKPNYMIRADNDMPPPPLFPIAFCSLAPLA
jgi:hypothetical protein